ncbi:hypothetical protein [Streptomyces sp. NPDC059071]|uniref:hypothetical protein n=1 Tax=unclassified Streptomyces TaxID=2593676 RepID=UPI00365775E6
MVRTRLKLAATLTVVVLALTGFQTSSSGGHGGGKSKSGKSRSSSSGGGGCSSSEKKNDDYDNASSGSGSSGSSGASGDPVYTPSPTSGPADLKVEVFQCVRPAEKKRKGKPARAADTTASIRVTPGYDVSGTYRVVLEFERGDGSPVDRGEIVIDVASPDSRIYDVAMMHPRTVAQVKRCTLLGAVRLSGVTPSPTASAS